MRWFAVVACSLAAATSVAAASPPNFEFRGHRPGEDLQAAFPRGLFTPCSSRSEPIVTCFDRTVGLTGGKTEEIGGVPIAGIDYLYYEQKLIWVEMKFHTEDFEAIREMLVGKYGEPAQEEDQQVQTALGATLQNRMVAWAFAEGRLVMAERYEQADQAIVRFEDTAARARLDTTLANVRRERGREGF